MSKVVLLPHDIGGGKDREVQVLLEDQSRKLVVIKLRREVTLDDHSARFPITIQALAGKGTLCVGGQQHALLPGVVVPVDAHAVHSVKAEPDVAILVTFFRQPEPQAGRDTTARFD